MEPISQGEKAWLSETLLLNNNAVTLGYTDHGYTDHGYTDHGYTEFTALTNKKMTTFFPNVHYTT